MSAALPWVHRGPRLAKRRDAHIAAEDAKQAGRLCQETRRTEMAQRKIRAASAPPLDTFAPAAAAKRGQR